VKLQILLKGKKGSALLLVMMIVAVLSILGVSIMGLALANYKMQVVDSKEKNTFYIAEAGLDETYGVIRKVIYQAIKTSKEEAKRIVDLAIQDEFYDAANRSDFGAEDYYLTTSAGGYNELNIETSLNTEFETNYKKYINDNLRKELGLDSDVHNWEYDIPDFPDSEFHKYSDSRNFTFKAISMHNEGGIQKQVETLFNIDVPDYDAEYTATISTAEENVLWLRPITVEGKIYTSSGKVEISGDVFAYNGMSIAGNVAIDGSIYSNGDIENTATSSKFLLGQQLNGNINRNLYCSSLKSNGESSTIEVYGNVFTKDDLELNGKKSKIVIDGSYYGFSNGNGNSDSSSCILINTTDIGESQGSSLSIAGNNRYALEDLDSGILVAGTAYVNADGDKYQTGESISIKGNYRVYSKPLSGLGVVGGIDYSKYNYSNIILDTFGTLQFPIMFKLDGINNNVPMYPDHKSTYFLKASGGPIFNDGKRGINISPSKILYSMGAWFGLDESNIQMGNHGEKSDDIFSDEIQPKVTKDFKYYTDKLGDPKITNHRDKDDLYLDTRLYIKNGINEGRYNFTKNEDSYDSNSHELTYISNDDSKPLYIIGDGGVAPSDQVANKVIDASSLSTSEAIDGIVITRGDIYISGRANYTGILVTERDIHFVDNGDKKIKYSKQNILERIAGNDIFKFTNGNPHKVLGILSSSNAPGDVTIDNLIKISGWKKTR